MQRPTLSLVIPVYNEEAVIPELDRRLRGFLGELRAGRPRSLGGDLRQRRLRRSLADLLNALAAAEPRYKIISFSRNFGHQMAITAGLDRAEGEAVVVMDADLQDPPELVRADARASGARASTSSTACAPSARARPGSSAPRRAIFYRVMRADARRIYDPRSTPATSGS